MKASTLESRARQWIEWDPNPATAQHVQELLDKPHELAALFGRRIAFGTAGLRAPMQAGPANMNDLVVLQTAQGIAKYCQEQHQTKCAVIGYDHRSRHSLSSLGFALWTALVFRQAGLETLLLDGFVATPIIPFCSEKYELGIMITASHNPAQDAGYKVYWRGCQIQPPMDEALAQSIQENLEPWTDYAKLKDELAATDPCHGLSDPTATRALVDAYFEAIQSFLPTPSTGPRFCYTALHGVGFPFAQRLFQQLNLDFVSVPAQQAPDPTFPTVPFPNPEEKGALELAQEYAQQHDCPLVVAHDPDADRLAVAELDGEWTTFTGDQIGVVLGHWLWQTQEGPIGLCASTVSSNMLGHIAQTEGLHFEETLTGFKWIGSKLKELNQDYKIVFGYEEAIGYCCGNVVFDKDGIIALGVLATLVTDVYRQGRTLGQHVQSLYDQYGEFCSYNGYYTLTDASVVPDIMNHISNHGKFDQIWSLPVESLRYLGEPGYDSAQPDLQPTLPTSQSAPMMTLRFTNGLVVSLRASGTEPKFKYYTELRGRPGVARAEVQAELMRVVPPLLEELLQPDKYGLRA